jgi:hypothetical protein
LIWRHLDHVEKWPYIICSDFSEQLRAVPGGRLLGVGRYGIYDFPCPVGNGAVFIDAAVKVDPDYIEAVANVAELKTYAAAGPV